MEIGGIGRLSDYSDVGTEPVTNSYNPIQLIQAYGVNSERVQFNLSSVKGNVKSKF